MRKGAGILILLFITHFCNGQTISPARPVNICTGNTETLSVIGLSAGETIQWQKNGADISRANKAEYEAKTTGDYRVKLRDGKYTNTVKLTTKNSVLQ